METKTGKETELFSQHTLIHPIDVIDFATTDKSLSEGWFYTILKFEDEKNNLYYLKLNKDQMNYLLNSYDEAKKKFKESFLN